MAKLYYFSGLIDKEKIDEAKVVSIINGKEYYNIGVLIRETPSGNEHDGEIVFNPRTKEERLNKKNKISNISFGALTLRSIYSDDRHKYIFRKIKDKQSNDDITKASKTIDFTKPFDYDKWL